MQSSFVTESWLGLGVQESCYSTAKCFWKVSDWGECSESCGVGTRARTVMCPVAATAACGISRVLPIDALSAMHVSVVDGNLGGERPKLGAKGQR